MFETIMQWFFAILTIIGGVAAIDSLCSGCVKKFNLIAYFRLQRRKRQQDSMIEPSGTVPLNSPFYVERQPIESECYQKNW